MKTNTIPLEHWAAFVAVVEQGGFARAAEHLNKSQSAVSYALAKLEQQLPKPVLQQQGRKAVLTEQGEVLYRRAKQLLQQAAELENTASCLAQGWEPQLTIAIDSLVPLEPVLRAMRGFGDAHPQTRLLLLETTLSGTDEAILERKADLALTPGVPPGFAGSKVCDVEMIPVAQANHSLARAKHPLNEQDLSRVRQIIIRDSGLKRNQDGGWLKAEQRFTVSHFATAIKMLEAGLGFSFVPRNLVEQQLAQGSLKRLNLEQEMQRLMPIYLLHTHGDQRGPGLTKLFELLRDSFG